MITTQAQDAINDLKVCGLKRDQFRVRTERLMNGRTFCGYGDAIISLLGNTPNDEQIAEMSKHFIVTRYKREDGSLYSYIHVEVPPHGKQPRLIIREL